MPLPGLPRRNADEATEIVWLEERHLKTADVEDNEARSRRRERWSGRGTEADMSGRAIC